MTISWLAVTKEARTSKASNGARGPHHETRARAGVELVATTRRDLPKTAPTYKMQRKRNARPRGDKSRGRAMEAGVGDEGDGGGAVGAADASAASIEALWTSSTVVPLSHSGALLRPPWWERMQRLVVPVELPGQEHPIPVPVPVGLSMMSVADNLSSSDGDVPSHLETQT